MLRSHDLELYSRHLKSVLSKIAALFYKAYISFCQCKYDRLYLVKDSRMCKKAQTAISQTHQETKGEKSNQ